MTSRADTNELASLFGAAATEKTASTGWITAYCDGGSRGNPGPSGFGVFIQDEAGKTVAELSEYLGKQTNNYAEYSGLLASLSFAVEQGHPRLKVVSDSELMVKQIKGQYQVKSPDLKPLYDEAKRRIARLDQFQIQHVLRGKNQQADRLANLAMDRGMGKTAAPERPAGRALDFRAAIKATSGTAPVKAEASPAVASLPAKSLRGFVKGGVIHLLEGELPDGVFVRVTREG